MKNTLPTETPCFKRWGRKTWSVFASLHRAVTIGVLAVGMSIILLAAETVSAHEIDSTQVMRELRIREVGISGSQSLPVRNIQSQTPLFNRKVQAYAPVHSLESALRLSPSVDVRERGGRGTQADISVRGGSFDQTMVLLNGINFTDARTGHQSHAIPVDFEAISSVELLDGIPGVGAYAGAVNIRTQPLLPTYLRLEGSGGQYGSAFGLLSGAVTAGRCSVFAAASYRKSDGYRQNTDFENINAFLRAVYDARRGGVFDVQVGYQDRQFGSNGFYAAYNPLQWEHTSTALTSLRWVKSTDRYSVGASAGYRKNFDRYDWTRGTAMNRHNTDNVDVKLWSDYLWRWGRTTLGGDYAFHHIYSTNLGEKMHHAHDYYTHAKARHIGNVYLNHAVSWQKVEASAAIGVSFTPYGTTPLWNVGVGYAPAEEWHIDAGLSQSMRLPTFTDLYYTSPAQINNLDLTPEKAVTLHLGAEYRRGVWHASLSGYHRWGRDIIDRVMREDMGNKWHSEQSSRLNTFGLEFRGGYSSEEGWLRQVTLSYGYVTSDKRTHLITQNSMDYMRHKAALSVAVHFLRNFSWVVTGSVYDRNGDYIYYPVSGDSSTSEIRRYKPYFLLDSRLSWEKGICRLYVDASNLTGQRYCDIGGIPLPREWFTFGAAITIGKHIKYK